MTAYKMLKYQIIPKWPWVCRDPSHSLLVTSDYQTKNRDFMMEVENDMECEQETLGEEAGKDAENDINEEGNEDEEASDGDEDDPMDGTTAANNAV
ncbi:hypothetical protein E1B28_003775 [Marasmius oreades]|uniref:Uncharacterized protein n=1 Tax=Marasmius oreades TaxID=181124 RepID=A0A9P7UX98_9AGAR|nr:uncharacterized protein E1B28_003775 [Marasmius oreades]KAG7096331.1 hypothetical protein E1B28_003775 [Marasmius oreades]